MPEELFEAGVDIGQFEVRVMDFTKEEQLAVDIDILIYH